MMITFQGLSKQKSPQVVYEDVFAACDPGTLEQLKELSSRRRAIESINQNSSMTEAIAREMSGGLTSRCEQNIQKVEQYLPLLGNLIHHVNLLGGNPKMVQWITELKIRWSSALTSSSFFQLSPKLYQMNSLYSELAMTLFLLGALLRDRALEVQSTDLVQSATILRKAAGVYHHLAQDVLTCLQPASAQERPPEAVISVSAAMNLVCLAEAQVLTVRKAEQKGITGQLLAKLHYGVCEFLDEAIHNLHSATKHCKDISSSLMDYTTTCKMLHELLSYKYFAESLKIEEQIGVAIGVLRHELQNTEKHTPKEESWRLVYKQVIDDSTGQLQKYERENEFVWHEKIPGHNDLLVPQGVKIVSCIPYQPQKWERTLVFRI